MKLNHMKVLGVQSSNMDSHSRNREWNWKGPPITQELSHPFDEKILAKPIVTGSSFALSNGAPHGKVLKAKFIFIENSMEKCNVAHAQMVTKKNEEVFRGGKVYPPNQHLPLLSERCLHSTISQNQVFSLWVPSHVVALLMKNIRNVKQKTWSYTWRQINQLFSMFVNILVRCNNYILIFPLKVHMFYNMHLFGKHVK